jgi:hypothetical protein
MKSAIASAFFLAGIGLAVGGCVAQERVVVARPARCRGAVWVAGGYGSRGRWHPGRWHCGGRVVIVQ